VKDSGMSRSFWWLNATQFLGALNDNIFKLLTFFFVIALLGKEQAHAWISLGGGIFVIPFLLFTPAAGVLADRVSKRAIVVGAKVLEIVVMLLAAWSFAAGPAVRAPSRCCSPCPPRARSSGPRSTASSRSWCGATSCRAPTASSC
jgi:MFS family permease